MRRAPLDPFPQEARKYDAQVDRYIATSRDGGERLHPFVGLHIRTVAGGLNTHRGEPEPSPQDRLLDLHVLNAVASKSLLAPGEQSIADLQVAASGDEREVEVTDDAQGDRQAPARQREEDRHDDQPREKRLNVPLGRLDQRPDRGVRLHELRRDETPQEPVGGHELEQVIAAQQCGE